MGAILGHPVIIFMPDWMSEERKHLLRSLGAEIVLVSREEGGFLGSIEKRKNLRKRILILICRANFRIHITVMPITMESVKKLSMK